MLTTFGSRAPLEPLGAALHFLEPVPWEVFASDGSRAILSALCLEAPRTLGGVVVISSTWRRAGSLDPFSWHQRFEAIDWRTGLYRDGLGELLLGGRPGSILAGDPLEALGLAIEWADRVAARLGSEFDVVYGDRRHEDHGHAERDGRKVASVFGGV